MNKRRDWLSFLTIVFAAGLGLQSAGYCQDIDPGFYETVKENFDAWDLNHDGILDEKEIQNKAFKSTKYTGQAAAAISVLKKIETSHFHKHEPLETFTLAQIEEMQNKGNPRRKSNDKVFKSTLKKIESGSSQLYAHGIPKIDEIKQGGANDCFFLAVVGSLVLTHLEQIQEMIETNADNNSHWKPRFVHP